MQKDDYNDSQSNLLVLEQKHTLKARKRREGGGQGPATILEIYSDLSWASARAPGYNFSIVGWSDLTLFPIFENLHISVYQS